MCGIAGLLFDDPQQASLEDLRTMLAHLVHRGPDGEGIEELGPCLLGHRRLSIIDLSPMGRQPLSNEDGTVWVTANGEIYNFQALRQELEAKGHRFRGHSDCEVLPHLYEEYGVEFVSKLRGMFALALWDTKNKRLVLARDRLGQKPLFYRQDPGRFSFASEALALHCRAPGELSPNFEALADYLSFGYVPSPSCAFAGSHKLAPGHVLVKDLGKPAKVQAYWTLSYQDKWPAKTSAQRHDLDERFRQLLDESVRLRQISDVPLGAFLSGGMDSASIVASMGSSGLDKPRTFTIGFEDGCYDERLPARQMARHVGSVHTEQVLEPHALTAVQALVPRFGEPFADSSALNCLALSALARQHVTVALSGDGGDELLGGYVRYVANDVAAFIDRWPGFARRRILAPLVSALPVRTGRDDWLFRAKRFMKAFLQGDPLRRALNWSALMPADLLEDLISPEFRQQIAGHDPFKGVIDRGLNSDARGNERALHMDLACYLPDDLLVKVDITSMAHGLECRAPFLDHHLVEFVARLPMSQKVHFGRKKRLLARAMISRVPREILSRPKKGFGVPIDRWLRTCWRDFMRDMLLSPRCLQRGLFSKSGVEKLVEEHCAGKWNWHHQLWALLMLELWFRMAESSTPAFHASL